MTVPVEVARRLIARAWRALRPVPAILAEARALGLTERQADAAMLAAQGDGGANGVRAAERENTR